MFNSYFAYKTWQRPQILYLYLYIGHIKHHFKYKMVPVIRTRVCLTYLVSSLTSHDPAALDHYIHMCTQFRHPGQIQYV